MIEGHHMRRDEDGWTCATRDAPQLGNEENVPVSQICRRTTVSESESTTRLVMKLAPTVEVIEAGLKAPLQYLMTRLVFPTPWAPRTTILASRDDIRRPQENVFLVSDEDDLEEEEAPRGEGESERRARRRGEGGERSDWGECGLRLVAVVCWWWWWWWWWWW